MLFELVLLLIILVSSFAEENFSFFHQFTDQHKLSQGKGKVVSSDSCIEYAWHALHVTYYW